MSTAPPSHSTSLNLPANLVAFFAAFFPPLSGIFFIVFEKKNALVRFHAMQAIVFGIFLMAGYLAIIFGVPPLREARPSLEASLVLGAYFFLVVVLVIWMVNVVAAICGKAWEIPVFGGIARRRLKKLDEKNNQLTEQ